MQKSKGTRRRGARGRSQAQQRGMKQACAMHVGGHGGGKEGGLVAARGETRKAAGCFSRKARSASGTDYSRRRSKKTTDE